MAPRAIVDSEDAPFFVGVASILLFVLVSIVLLGAALGLAVRAFHLLAGG